MSMHSAAILSAYKVAVNTSLPGNPVKEKIKVTAQNLFINDSAIDMHAFNSVKVFAAGKAAAAMAKECETILGDLMSDSFAVSKYGHSMPLKHFRYIEAGHPLPDKNSAAAAEALLRFAAGIKENDIFLLLLSGGASSLLTDIPAGCTLEDIQKANLLLIHSGCTIYETNTVRKHLSSIKGGQLLRHVKAKAVISLIISDVPGDDISTIASGLTAADESTFADAINVLKKYSMENSMPVSVMKYLTDGAQGLFPETIKPGDLLLEKVSNTIIASNSIAVNTAKAFLRETGYFIAEENNNLNGDTNEKAVELSGLLVNYKGNLPAVFVWGGESTLKVTGHGKGGRNQHMALAILHELKLTAKLPGSITVLCAGTDGTDGPTDAAGAVVNDSMIADTEISIETIKHHINSFDSYNFFNKYGGLFVTGPTQTNVMDLVIATIHPVQ